VLTRGRAAAAVAVGSIIALTSSMAASAAPAMAGTRAGRPAAARIPSSAKRRLISETLGAWQITKGAGATVAVLGTPIDAVTGLAGKVTYGPDFAPLAGAPATDSTVLASLIAGSGPTAANPFGTVGRAPAARILAERIVDYNGGRGATRYQQDGRWQAIMARAIRYAVNHGASVIVPFESGYADTAALDSAVQYAISKNVVVLGTDSAFGGTQNGPMYPDSLPGVINFSGVTISGLPKPPKSVRSPVNNSILVAAPDNILFATGPGNASYYAYGNYSATAWVAGTVALIKSVYPQITPAEVALALADSASYHPAGGYNTTIGFGLINPLGALHAATGLLKLHRTASPGQGSVAANARFSTAMPGVIDAVQNSPIELGLYGAAIVVGVILLAVAAQLNRKRRRRGALASAAPVSDADQASAVG
jgi:hypothetical protein